MADLDWIWWSMGAAAGLAGLAILYFGLFHDRARGRKRCPKCWYDMAGVPGLVCPECGRDARREKRLGRTRRRWLVGTAGAILALAATGAASWPSMRGDDWWHWVPMDILVRLMPAPGDEIDPKTRTLRPALVELQRRVPVRTFAGRHWRTFLANSGVVLLPGSWPADQPMMVATRESAVNLGPLTEVRLTPRIAGAPTLFIGQTTPAVLRPHDAVAIGLLPAGTKRLEFDVEVYSGRRALDSWNAAPERIWSGRVALPVRLVASVDEFMRPDDSPALTRAVQGAVSIQYYTSGNGCWMNVSIPGFGISAGVPRDVALGIRIEVLHDGAVVGGRDYRARLAEPPRKGWIGPSGASETPVDAGLLPSSVSEMSGWTVRVVGSRGLALPDFVKTRCWTGEYTVPLSSLVFDMDAATKYTPLSVPAPQYR